MTSTSYSLYLLVLLGCVLWLSSLILPEVVYGQGEDVGSRPAEYVNTFIGTTYDRANHYNRGNVHVGPFRPFGLIKPGPDTEASGLSRVGNGGYKYNDSTVVGFSQLHMSGTGGRAESQSLALMPTVGELETDSRRYRSRFDHRLEDSEPGYYRVRLLDYDVDAELAATERVAIYRFTFPETDDANILVNVAHAFNPYLGGEVRIVDNRTIVGAAAYRGYKDSPYDITFRIEFSKPFQRSGVWTGDHVRTGSSSASAGDDEPLGAFVRYATDAREAVVVKVAISYVDLVGAERNMQKELPHWEFDDVHNTSWEIWNDLLGQVQVRGGSEADRIKFYSALYHSYSSPSMLSDVDGRYEGFDGEIHEAEGFTYYGEFSLWDTYRTVHPLLALLQPQRQRDMAQSLVLVSEQGGWLPKWGWSEGYTGGMLGDHATSVLADTYVKGITDFDAESAFAAVRKNAMKRPAEDVTWGRRGLEEYLRLGYVPEEPDVDAHGSTSTTLEFAYDDWAAARLAEALGKTEEMRYFDERARNYRHVFDPSVNFMRPRHGDGSWAMDPFIPTRKGRGSQFYAEGNAWTYTWLVQHDPQGLINLFGGRGAFTAGLDSMFAGDTFDEMLYWHDNEPDMHYAYMYDYAGQPWKTQRIARRIMDEVYGIGPYDGLPHADDVGTLSAWFVLSAFGLYPMAPGEPVYVLGSPLFNEIELQLNEKYYGGRTFTIQAVGNAPSSPYIHAARLNGEEHEQPWLSHRDIVEGDRLVLQMSSTPNRDWGAEPSAAPPSLTKEAPAFTYGPLQLPDRIVMDEPATINVDVSNRGGVGTASTELYYFDDTGEMPGAMPIGTARTVLARGETKTISFRIPFYRPGQHELQVNGLDRVDFTVERR